MCLETKSLRDSALEKRVLRSRKTLWASAIFAVLCGALWDFYPLPGAEQRLQEIPKRSADLVSSDLPLTAQERAVLGRVAVVHRSCRFKRRVFILTVIDGTRDRHAVHDPRYCFQGAGWRIAAEKQLPIQGGGATWLRIAQANKQGEAVFWFSDGDFRHSSFPKYWWQTTLRRLTLGRCGAEPVLVVLQSYGEDQPAWPGFVKELVVVLKL